MAFQCHAHEGESKLHAVFSRLQVISLPFPLSPTFSPFTLLLVLFPFIFQNPQTTPITTPCCEFWHLSDVCLSFLSCTWMAYHSLRSPFSCRAQPITSDWVWSNMMCQSINEFLHKCVSTHVHTYLNVTLFFMQGVCFGATVKTATEVNLRQLLFPWFMTKKLFSIRCEDWCVCGMFSPTFVI